VSMSVKWMKQEEASGANVVGISEYFIEQTTIHLGTQIMKCR